MARLVLAGAVAAAGIGAGVAVAVRKKGKDGQHDGSVEDTISMHALPSEPDSGTPADAAASTTAVSKPDPVAAALKGNEALFTGKELDLVKMLVQEDQGQLFVAWPPLGEHDADKRRMVQQLVLLDGSYHGGLKQYIVNARQLLQDSKEGRNAFDGFTPSTPEGERLDFCSKEFLQLEEGGLAAAAHATFVLVAGGLGERLGYKGIKVALPSESATGRCFLQLYIQTILALQDASGASARGIRLPLAIMTSDDTHARTEALLKTHGYFGMQPDQVVLIKQEKVPCLMDNAAHLCLDPSDPYMLQTKPHGHGDVHSLLHSSGLARKWQQQGFKWVCFFQDTNALVFRALLAALGLSAAKDYDMNSVAVPRKAKEAIGAIARLTATDGSGRAMTVNVEYNLLDPLLRSTINPQGDVNDATGYSPFPGNINQLVIKLSSYMHQLDKTGGTIGEFVNPKYKDATKTAFKSSTRLECMMQDYPKALPPDARVGFTVINQVWATYSPVKNSPDDARAKAAEGNPTHSATTGEMDIYKANCEALLIMCGADVGQPQHATFNGIPVEDWPRVVLSPSFAPCMDAIKSKVSQGGLMLAPGSVMVLDGADIHIKNLRVDGALLVRAVPGARVVIDGLTVSNKGWSWTSLEQLANPTPEEAIRGFRVERKETQELVFDKPGEYLVPLPAPKPAAVQPQAQAAAEQSAGVTDLDMAGLAQPAAVATPAAAPAQQQVLNSQVAAADGATAGAATPAAGFGGPPCAGSTGGSVSGVGAAAGSGAVQAGAAGGGGAAGAESVLVAAGAHSAGGAKEEAAGADILGA